MARVLIAGCGYVGTELGIQLVGRGHEVWALRRRAAGLPSELRAIAADLGDPASLRSLPWPFETIFFTAAAGERSDDAYLSIYVRALETLLDVIVQASGRSLPQRVFYTSSTSVYGQSSGEWVDETSPTEPRHFTGLRVLEGEEILHSSGLPVTTVRLGGIYGPGRTALLRSVLEGRAALGGAAGRRFTNRIHRDDAAAALTHLSSLEFPRDLYIGVDREPALRDEVLAWLARRAGVDLSTVHGEPARPRAGGNRPATHKRCSSARLQASGYTFLYPTYRHGYAALLARGTSTLAP